MSGITLALLLRLGLAGGLAAAVAARHEAAQSPGMEAQAASVAARAASTERAASVGQARAAELAATIAARPLFDPRRKPPMRDAAESSLAPSLPRLTGIVTSSDAAWAIFETSRGNRPLVMREGDRVGGRLIQSISSGGITVQDLEGARILPVVRARTEQ